MKLIALAVATSCGVGYVPVAPGTFGSLAGLALWWILPHTWLVQFIAIVILFVAGAWSAGAAERHFGGTDPGQVVVDEVLGMLVTLFLVPVNWIGALVAFLWFRVFDIVKPYPANKLEQLHGGVGVMADDAMAAVYANVALRATAWLFGTWILG
jgi:phosphatidylglycerophosphatase A